MVFGKVLQILVMGRDDTKCLLLPELLQHGLGYGTANGWFSTATEFVNQQQCTFIRLTHHLLHIHQV